MVSPDYEEKIEEELYDFSTALDYLKQGKIVTRKGWNWKNMFLFLVKWSMFRVNREPLLSIFKGWTEINYKPHIDIKTANWDISTWVASQTDLLSKDWIILD